MSGRELSRDEVIDVLATMIRDEAYPEFGLAPPPEWASRAAAKVIDYHQPMLRDHLVREAVDAFLASPQAAEELARALAPHQTEAGPFSALVDEGDRWHYHLASPSEFASVLLTAWQKLRHPEEA